MSKARDLANAGTALTTVSATELGYLDGVTSAVQTQIDSKIGSSSAINPTIVDAKGDLIAATAADTVARLAVGANDTVLTADSTAATGLKWGTPASGSLTLLSTTTFNNTAATYTVSSLGTYRNLLVVGSGLQSAAAGYAALSFRFNGDTAANYWWASILNNNNAATRDSSGGAATQIATSGVGLANTTQTSGAFGQIVMTVNDYSTAGIYKAIPITAGQFEGSVGSQASIYGNWNNTAAITSITFFAASNLKAGTIKIYGVN